MSPDSEGASIATAAVPCSCQAGRWPSNPAFPDLAPDWYFAFLEGSLRLMPGAETNVGDRTIAWDVFIPAVLLPIVFFLMMGGYPFFERWVTGDSRPHNVLDRPRVRAAGTP